MLGFEVLDLLIPSMLVVFVVRQVWGEVVWFLGTLVTLGDKRSLGKGGIRSKLGLETVS